MNHSRKLRRSPCPITYTLEIMGDRWSMLIIRDMVFMGKSSYGEFSNSPEGIATNVLADRLKRLEEQGIISKKLDPDKRSKFIYGLTNMGLDLIPILVEMTSFGGKYDKHTGAPKETLVNIKRNKQEFIKKLLEKQSQRQVAHH